MTFSEIKETGNGELRWRFVIEGYRTQWVSSYDMELIGFNTVRKVGLISDNIRFSENAILTEGKLEASSMTIRINDVDGEATAAFVQKPTKVGRLAASISDTETTIEIIGADQFSNNSAVYLGGECILLGTRSGDTFTGCFRGYRDTIKRWHYIATELGVPHISYVENAWRTPQQRRCFVYAYGTDDNPIGNGRLVWQGIIKTGNITQGDMLSYELDAEPISSIFETDFGTEREGSLGLRGYNFPPDYPWQIAVYQSYPVTGTVAGGIAEQSWNTINTNLIPNTGFAGPYRAWEHKVLISGSGFYETLNDLVDDLNTQLETEITAGGWEVLPNFYLPIDEPNRIASHFQVANNRVCKILATRGYPAGSWPREDRFVPAPFVVVGPEQDAEIIKPFWETAEYDNTGRTRQGEVHSDLATLGFQQFGLGFPYEYTETQLSGGHYARFGYPLTSGSGDYVFTTLAPWPDATNVHLSRLGGSGRLTLSSSVAEWFVSGYPVTDSDNSYSVVANLSYPSRVEVTAGGPRDSQILLSGTNEPNQSLYVPTFSFLGPDTGWQEVWFDAVMLGRDAINLKSAMLIAESGNFYSFMSGIVALSPLWAGLGLLPPLTASMFNLPEISASVAAVSYAPSVIQKRRYQILNSEESLSDFIAEELKLINHMPKIDAEGRWSIAPIQYSTRQEAVYEIDATNHLTDNGFGSYEQNEEGIRNQAVLKSGYSFTEAEHQGTPFTIRWAESQAMFNGKSKTLEIAPMSAESQPVTPGEAYEILWRPLGIFGQDYKKMTVEVPFTMFDAVIGTPVTFTSLAFPNPATGERGISRVAARVIGREMRADGFGSLTLFASENDFDGYSPSLRVISGTMTANGLTGTFYVDRYNFAISGVQDASYFPVGTKVLAMTFAHTGSDPWTPKYTLGTVSVRDLAFSALTSSIQVRFNSAIQPELTGSANWSRSGMHRIIYPSYSILAGQSATSQSDGFVVIESRVTGSADYFGG